jgi:hypothetical protein
MCGTINRTYKVVAVPVLVYGALTADNRKKIEAAEIEFLRLVSVYSCMTTYITIKYL